MTLFDVDGALAPAALAIAGAAAAARAIRRFGIGGSIGIDLPTLPRKDERQAAAAALDAALPQPFERTAVNGFGFLQIVRRRERASLPELLQGDPRRRRRARLAARRPSARRARAPRTITAAPAVIAAIEAQPDWTATLARRIGAAVGLRADPALAISAGHVHTAHNSTKPRRNCPLCGKPASASIRPSAARAAATATCSNGSAKAIACPGRPVDEEGREIGADGLDSEGQAPL